MIDTIAATAQVNHQKVDSVVGRHLTTNSGMRYIIANGQIRFEMSLPKLFFGTNCRCLRNQEEMDQAIQVLARHLSDIAEVCPMDDWIIRRLDLAWNFSLPASRYLTAYSVVKLESMRKGPIHAFDQWVTWSGDRKRILLRMYNKSIQAKSAGEVLRVELSLRGRQIRKRLLDKQWNKFTSVYGAFREELIKLPAIYGGPAQKVWAALGREAPEVRARVLNGTGGTRQTRWRRRQQMEIAASGIKNRFEWNEFLPEDRPPNAATP